MICEKCGQKMARQHDYIIESPHEAAVRHEDWRCLHCGHRQQEKDMTASRKWFAKMPDGTLRRGVAHMDMRTDPPTERNGPPAEGEEIAEGTYHYVMGLQEIVDNGWTKGEPMTKDHWKHRSKHMKCHTCMWFVEKAVIPLGLPNEEEEVREMDPRARLGRCRRHAPTMSGYPAVYETDWCGDHKIDEEKV